MMNHRKLKVGAAAAAIAAVGTGAALAATNGSNGAVGATGTSTTRSANTEPGPPHGGRPGGMFDADLAAAATYLGTTKAELQTQLRTGKTLAQVAKATDGKSVSGLVSAIVAAETKTITQRVTDFVNGNHPPGAPPGGAPSHP